MRYFYIRLKIQQSEYEHTSHSLCVDKTERSSHTIGLDFAKGFWDDPKTVEVENDVVLANNGDMSITVSKVQEITKEEYEDYYKLLYS